MTHEKALELMPAYFQNALDRSTVKDLHAHFNSCEDCQVRLRTMRAVAPNPGFTRSRDGWSPGTKERMDAILKRNRTMTAIVLLALTIFFLWVSRSGLKIDGPRGVDLSIPPLGSENGGRP